MKDLNEIRKEIDAVDRNMVELFEKRMKLVMEVAEYKKKNNLPVLDAVREKKVISKNVSFLRNEKFAEPLKEFYTNFIELSKKLEGKEISAEGHEKEFTNIYGLIGEKLGHSYSSDIHKLIMGKIGIKGIYNLFEIPRKKLHQAVDTFEIIKCKGLNVTIPYKVDVMEDLCEVSDEAKKIGAVNTLKFTAKGIMGFNTDYIGFGKMLKKFGVEVKDKTCMVLGSGGAAKAVIQYLKDSDAKKIYIVSRNPERVRDAYKDFDVINYKELESKSGDVIINCTPKGMYPKVDESPVNKSTIAKYSAAVDLIYNPVETLFLKYAKDAGITAVNGLYMLVSQAISSEEIWNDISIEDSVADEIFNIIEKKVKP
ncbi:MULTISPECIES: shikimate dehydrogenase [Clostridium]|uniref:shikimate dehydrogenase n=1 Tax=Clostridium TaxID=1485 RepID=UPI0008258EFF|nr:chorismate mutase [Clostridium sp. CT7]